MEITLKIPAATFDEIATEVTRRVLVQLGRANDEVPVTKDAPVVAPTVEEEDPTVEIGTLGQPYSVGELRDLGKRMITSGAPGARDTLIEILSGLGTTSLSSLATENYSAAGDAMNEFLKTS